MDELIRLSNATLGELPPKVKRPRYDRGRITPGIVHIGLGNFHRAHQGWYLHQLFNAGQDLDWGVIGAGVRPHDAVQRDKLRAQDYLSTLIELDPSGMSAEVSGSLIHYVPVEETNTPLVHQIADRSIRIVSLTVTEGGYYQDADSGAFSADHADIRNDVQNPAQPRTAFGAIVEALKQRRAADTGPLTLQSCDNLQGNGNILRQTVVSLARLSDPVLADWINENCSFPNSMVDCIVPAVGPRELALVNEFGIHDEVPVTHEKFRQWVIEDDFCSGRPNWEAVGVTFTKNVHAYESMKIRILNAGHQIIANIGELLSIETIAECMAHPQISALLDKVLAEEIAPHVESVPNMTPADYTNLIKRRFSNPTVIDTTRRVAFDGSSRHPGFLLPTIRDGIKSGTPIEGLALVEALWARMCAGTREDGSSIQPNDPHWTSLNKIACAAKDRPLSWLEQRSIYGNLVEDQKFSSAFSHQLQKLWSSGSIATIKAYSA